MRKPIPEHFLHNLQLRLRNVFRVERPKKEGILVLEFKAEKGWLVDKRLTRDIAWRSKQRLPPSAVVVLELGIEHQGGKRVSLAVITLEPRMIGTGTKPKRKIDREMGINAFGLHRLDNCNRAFNGSRVQLAVVIENRAVAPDQIHPVLREQPRGLAQGRAVSVLLRRAVDGPKAHRLSVAAVNEVTALSGNESVFARKSFVQKSQVYGAVCERVGRRLEPQPAILGRGLRRRQAADFCREHNSQTA